MLKYKTVVTDYEGLQECLDSHAELGWKLFSVSADTWRKVIGTSGEGDALEALGAPSGAPTSEFSASYYLVIVCREDGLERETAHAEALHEVGESLHYENY